MLIFEPHIHMFSRITDDYEKLSFAGVRAVLEPAFWLGQNRTSVGTFVDYFETLIGWERHRAQQFGIHHFCTMGLNPREAFPVVRRLCAETNLVGFDLVEYAPDRDPGYVTGLIANRLLRRVRPRAAIRLAAPGSTAAGPRAVPGRSRSARPPSCYTLPGPAAAAARSGHRRERRTAGGRVLRRPRPM